MINIEKRSKNSPNLQVGIKKITLRLRIFEKFVFYIFQIFQKSGVPIINPVPSLNRLCENTNFYTVALARWMRNS
ncbi:hypothetical protein SAMN05444280_1445 [Tangfeifania diversioriginum]|uniref:Uncharacterized protein n=1 Tax=Tangfeifania diversioriginum TaxID=1168035 RepID=A0A1M6NMC9_9BACT|nr:hypothetical protein SAMN05444280_1445 [Tangfeifania diversioriginum]